MRHFNILLLLVVAAIGYYLVFRSSNHAVDFATQVVQSKLTPTPPQTQASAQSAAPRATVDTSPTTEATPAPRQELNVDLPAAHPVKKNAANSGKAVLPYTIVNGIITVQGDIVVGIPTREGVDEHGLVEVVPGGKWGNVIPFHIQPDVVNPERVLQAIALFEGSAIRFVPQQGEQDVLVFETGEKNCLSYVGKVGGKQPVLIEPKCGPAEIAHEIMHALGFVHEQNRTDRDGFIAVNFDSIDEAFKNNFEKLPIQFMSVTGLESFDFESIMIYPPWMFAKPGRSTMEPLNRDHLIRPSSRLSAGDLRRLNRAYGQ